MKNFKKAEPDRTVAFRRNRAHVSDFHFNEAHKTYTSEGNKVFFYDSADGIITDNLRKRERKK